MSRKRGRLHEDHYFIDHEESNDDEGDVEFVLCTPANRVPACPVCEAKTLEGVRRRFRVESDHWQQWVAIDTRREAKWLAEEGAYDYDAKPKDFRISPLWMVKGEAEQMPEWCP